MLQGLTRRLDSGESLTDSEASHALESILHPGTADEEIESFLRALSRKGETPDEIAGFARVMRKHCVQVSTDHPSYIDTAGTGGGGESFNISTTAAFVIAGAGLPVAKHGNRAVTSRSGSADMLAALGVDISASPEVSSECLSSLSIAFFFAPVFHPSMKRVAEIRRKIGHRTIFNLLGPLTNPAAAPYQLIGAYSSDLTRKLGRALARLGCRRAWVVHSDDGLDELSSLAPSSIAEVEGDTVLERRFDPEPFGFNQVGSYPAGDAAQNAQLCLEILKGKRRGVERDVVILNAAAALHVAGVEDFSAAVSRAEDSITSGVALEKLQRLAEATSSGRVR